MKNKKNDLGKKEPFMVKYKKPIMIISTIHIVICWILTFAKSLDTLLTLFQSLLYTVNPYYCFFEIECHHFSRMMYWSGLNFANLFLTIIYFV